MTDALLLVATVVFWSLVIDAAAYRFPRLAATMKARPRTLIHGGRPNRHVMRVSR